MRALQIKPGTQDANVAMHLSMFGNTTRILQGEPAMNIEKGRDRLERIGDLIFWNTNEIMTLNEDLRNPNSFINLFDRQHEGRAKLVILHYQRERLVRIWNNHLKLMAL